MDSPSVQRGGGGGGGKRPPGLVHLGSKDIHIQLYRGTLLFDEAIFMSAFAPPTKMCVGL